MSLDVSHRPMSKIGPEWNEVAHLAGQNVREVRVS